MILLRLLLFLFLFSMLLSLLLLCGCCLSFTIISLCISLAWFLLCIQSIISSRAFKNSPDLFSMKHLFRWAIFSWCFTGIDFFLRFESSPQFCPCLSLSTRMHQSNCTTAHNFYVAWQFSVWFIRQNPKIEKKVLECIVSECQCMTANLWKKRFRRK